MFRHRGAILRDLLEKKEVHVMNYILFSVFLGRCIVSIEHVRILFAAFCSASEFFRITKLKD